MPNDFSAEKMQHRRWASADCSTMAMKALMDVQVHWNVKRVDIVDLNVAVSAASVGATMNDSMIDEEHEEEDSIACQLDAQFNDEQQSAHVSASTFDHVAAVYSAHVPADYFAHNFFDGQSCDSNLLNALHMLARDGLQDTRQERQDTADARDDNASIGHLDEPDSRYDHDWRGRWRRAHGRGSRRTSLAVAL